MIGCIDGWKCGGSVIGQKCDWLFMGGSVHDGVRMVFILEQQVFRINNEVRAYSVILV